MPSHKTYSINKFPKSRIATIDVSEIGKKKHHVAAFLEIDVTLCREKIKSHKRNVSKISFMAWMIKVISTTLKDHKSMTAYLKGKNKIMIFNDINISVLIEKEINGEKVPLPLLIEKAETLEMEDIAKQINNAKQKKVTEDEIVIQKKTKTFERFYYYLPGPFRRFIWKNLLKHPSTIFAKMGNVTITSIGMFGKINGWFLPISIHPVCIGVGSIIKKPVVVDEKIEIREIMNMTVLLDHDIVDGAPMARFISALTKNIENAMLL